MLSGVAALGVIVLRGVDDVSVETVGWGWLLVDMMRALSYDSYEDLDQLQSKLAS